MAQCWPDPTRADRRYNGRSKTATFRVVDEAVGQALEKVMADNGWSCVRKSSNARVERPNQRHVTVVLMDDVFDDDEMTEMQWSSNELAQQLKIDDPLVNQQDE